MHHILEREILQYFRLLEKAQQHRVLDYIKSLAAPTKLKNEEMLKLAGTIDKKSLTEIQTAIEEGCNDVVGYE